MGGFGSGCYPRKGGRRKCENALPLDIRKLHREGHLVPGSYLSWVWTRSGKKYSIIGIWVEEDHLTLEYMKGEDEVRQRISLSWTPCNYGGKRVWFTCPYCLGRCAILYIMGRHYVCRKCAGVVHKSNIQDDIQRRLNKAGKLRVKIGALPAPAYDLPKYKPIHMHRRTWNKARLDIYALELPFWERSSRRTDILEKKLSATAIAKRMGCTFKDGKLKRI